MDLRWTKALLATLLVIAIIMITIIGYFPPASADTITYVGVTPYGEFTVNEYVLTMDSGGNDTTGLTYPVTGKIICIDTDPGETAPTASYDMKAYNAQGIDVMGGGLGDRHTSNSERAWPKDGSTVIYTGVPTQGSLSIYRENNVVQDAEVTIRIFVENQKRR